MSRLVAGAGVAGLAAVAGAVAFLRSKASGHIYAELNVPAAPAALVLGAKVNPDGTPSAFLTARLDLAKRLYDARLVEMIIVSGDRLAPEFDEPVAMRNYLIRAGLPNEKVIVDPGGFDTYESCLRARRILNLSQLIVVTQSYHLVRAVATCRTLGIDAMGVGDDSARQHTIAWWRGAIRDQLACLKTIIDLVHRQDPKFGELNIFWGECAPSGMASPISDAPLTRLNSSDGARTRARPKPTFRLFDRRFFEAIAPRKSQRLTCSCMPKKTGPYLHNPGASSNWMRV